VCPSVHALHTQVHHPKQHQPFGSLLSGFWPIFQALRWWVSEDSWVWQLPVTAWPWGDALAHRCPRTILKKWTRMVWLRSERVRGRGRWANAGLLPGCWGWWEGCLRIWRDGRVTSVWFRLVGSGDCWEGLRCDTGDVPPSLQVSDYNLIISHMHHPSISQFIISAMLCDRLCPSFDSSI